MVGMIVGSRNPNATPPLPTMNERENAASRFSRLVWSAISAFHVESAADSAIPRIIVATTRRAKLNVRAIIMIGGGTSALPIKRSFFRPFLSENIPRGIERRTMLLLALGEVQRCRR